MRTRLLRSGAAAVTAAALASVLSAPTARAIPEDGASANTPGTSASVAPTSLTAGSTLTFRVAGFPAGEVVNVKIDDGLFCSQSGTHGACVVHMQRIGSDGRASGSFTLPADLKPGRHWLRFLASKEVAGGGGGTLGYTLRSPQFTITPGTPATSETPGSPQAPNTPGADPGSTPAAVGAPTGATGSEREPSGVVPGASTGSTAPSGTAPTTGVPGEVAAVTAAGTPVALSAGPAQPTPTAEPEPSAATSPATTTEAVAAAEAATVPWLGIGGGAALLALAAGTLLLPRRRPRA